MAVVRPETAENVRLALGLLTAVEWDSESGDPTHGAQRRYMAESGESVEELIRGLVIVARGLVAAQVVRDGSSHYTVLGRIAKRANNW